MLDDIVGQLVASDPQARHAALRNILSKTAYHLVDVKDLANNSHFVRNALRWFDGSTVAWDEQSIALLQLLVNMLQSPIARRSALDAGGLQCLYARRSESNIPPSVSPLLDAAICLLRSPAKAPAQSQCTAAQASGLLRPYVPKTSTIGSAAVPHTTHHATSHQRSPKESFNAQPMGSPMSSPGGVGPLEGNAELPPTHLTFWLQAYERSVSQQRARQGRHGSPLLFDTAVRLRHSDPSVVRDACSFLCSALNAGLPVMDIMIEAGLLLTVADAMYGAAIRVRSNDPRGGHAPLHLLCVAIECLHNAVTHCNQMVGSLEGERCTLIVSACLLLAERCIQSLLSISCIVSLAGLLATLLPIFQSAVKQLCSPTAGVTGMKDLEHFQEALRHLLTDALSRMTVLLNFGAKDPATGGWYRHLLPVAIPDDDEIPSTTQKTPPFARSPQHVLEPPSAATAPPTPLSVAAIPSSPSDSSSPSEVIGWRHLPLALWLHVVLELHKLLCESTGNAIPGPQDVLWFQLLKNVSSHATIESLSHHFPKLYAGLRNACSGTLEDQPLDVPVKESEERLSRHALFLFQLLGCAAHPREFLVTLECLLAVHTLQPGAMAIVLMEPGDALHVFTKYLKKPPSNQMDHLVVRHLLIFCIGLLDSCTIQRADLQFFFSITVKHLVPNLLLTFRSSPQAGDPSRHVPVLESLLIFVCSLMRALLQANAHSELAALVTDEELWHHLSLLLVDVLEQTIAGKVSDGQHSAPGEYVAASLGTMGIHILQTISLAATVSGLYEEDTTAAPVVAGRFRMALLTLFDIMGCYAKLNPRVIRDNQAYIATNFRQELLSSANYASTVTVQMHLHKGLLRHCVSTLICLTEQQYRAGGAWAEMVNLKLVSWMQSSRDVALQTAYHEILANAFVNPQQVSLVLQTIPEVIDDALGQLTNSNSPVPLQTAILRLLTVAMEMRSCKHSMHFECQKVAPGVGEPVENGAIDKVHNKDPEHGEDATSGDIASHILDQQKMLLLAEYVWSQLAFSLKGGTMPISLLLRAALALLSVADVGPPAVMQPEKAVLYLLDIMQDTLKHMNGVCVMQQLLDHFCTLNQLWNLCWLLMQHSGITPLSHFVGNTLMPQTLIASLTAATCQPADSTATDVHPCCPRISVMRHTLVALLLTLLETMMHNEPLAWSSVSMQPMNDSICEGRLSALLVSFGAIIISSLFPLHLRGQAAAALAFLLHGTRQAQLQLQVPARAACASTPELSNAEGQGNGDSSDGINPGQSIGALLFQVLISFWNECSADLLHDRRLLVALHGAVCAVLLYSDEAKQLALQCGWAAHLLNEVQAVPDLLRFAVVHTDPGKARADQDAHVDGLEERLFIALAQLQNLVVRCNSAKQLCNANNIMKLVATIFSLLPYRQAALSKETNRQNRLLSDILTFITNLCAGCKEVQTSFAADPSRQNKSLLNSLLNVAILAGAPKAIGLGQQFDLEKTSGHSSMEGKGCKLNPMVFHALFEAIAAIVTDNEVAVAVIIKAGFLSTLSQSVDAWLKQKPSPNVTRLTPVMVMLANFSFHEKGQAAILQTPHLLSLVLQCIAIQPSSNVKEQTCNHMQLASLLLLRNLSFFPQTKVHVTNERSLDTLSCIMKTLREPGAQEQCLAAEALLALVHNNSKARSVIKQQDMWHAELADISHGLRAASVAWDRLGPTIPATSAALHERVLSCLETILDMLA